ILTVGKKRSLDVGIPLGVALKETLILAIALAVGAIPEGLPAVVTIALAIGVQRMARRNAIIRRLPAVETLGSTTVICSDKTGTLTCNEMTVTELVTLEHRVNVSGIGYEPVGAFSVNGEKLETLPVGIEKLLQSSVLCNDAALYREQGEWTISGDPTEASLLVAAAKAGLSVEATLDHAPRLDVIPFSSEAQSMLTLHGGEKRVAVLKGAPEVVVKHCKEAEEQEVYQRIATEMHRMGERGMRVLALACMDWPENEPLPPEIPDQGFVFLGLVGMIDPARSEAIAAIEVCHRAGIKVKMITGDHKITAAAIGRELNLASDKEAVTGAELDGLTEAELRVTVRECNIFARVAPEHKLRLVKALQADKQIVAMTGDGVNDAPSLKQANIGVAMGITGTAVSKESADIVLADDNFASISAAVEEGRRVYDNLLKSLAFLLPTNLGLALILIYGIMFFPFDPVGKVLLLPMLPTQLLWINLVAAVALALPLAFEVKEANIMHRPPRDPARPLFSAFIVFRVVLVSLLMTAGTIILFYLTYNPGMLSILAEARVLARSQTIAVTYVILFQIFYMLHCRALTDSLRKIGFFSNKMVFWGIGVVLVLQALFIYLPFLQKVFKTVSLSAGDLGIAFLAALSLFPVISLEKWIRSRKAMS
ncbi:MAG: cation-translocating P-type ATPase, partial [Desulfobulbus sp.]